MFTNKKLENVCIIYKTFFRKFASIFVKFFSKFYRKIIKFLINSKKNNIYRRASSLFELRNLKFEFKLKFHLNFFEDYSVLFA